MIKAVIFDLGNVLVRFDHMIACRKLAKFTANDRLSAIDVYHNVIEDPIIFKYEKGIITSWEYYNYLIERLRLEVDYERFSLAWAEIFEINAGMEEILVKLKQQFPLYIISNTNEIHFKYVLNHFPILQHFSEFVLSYEVGYIKPEKEIYEKILNKTGHSANHCLYIDDIKSYIQAAAELGFQGIHFKNPEQLGEELKTLGVILE